MAVKVLIVLSAVLFCVAQADVSHLNLTALNSNKEAIDTTKIKDTKIELKSPRLQARQALFTSEPKIKPKTHEGYGYIYRKPSIPFITGNQVQPQVHHQGYNYPKPALPFTYPPPSPTSSITEQSFPDATARLRAK